MSSWRRFQLLVPAILVAIAALCSSGCCTLNCCETRGHNQVVLLGPGPENVDPKVPAISKAGKNQIAWVSSNGRPVRISVRVDVEAGQSQPFEDMMCDDLKPMHCEVKCPESAVCLSGMIRNDLKPSKKGLYYDYDWSFRTPSDGKGGDPGFIIKP